MKPLDQTLEISTALTVEDQVAISAYGSRAVIARQRWRGLAVGLTALAGGIAAELLVIGTFGDAPPTALLGGLPYALASPFGGLLLLAVVLLLVRCAFYGRLFRRRLRAQFLAEHGGAPLPATYRFDEAGCTVEDSISKARFPWDAFVRFEETPDLVCLTGPAGSGAGVALPRRGLAPGDASRLRAILPARLRDASPWPALPGAFELPTLDVGAAEVVLRYEQGPEDLVAARLAAWDTPRTKRLRAVGAVAPVLGAGLALAVIAALRWLSDPAEHPVGDLADALLHGAPEAWGVVLLVVAAGALAWVLWPLRLRCRAVSVGRALAEGTRPVRLAIGADGIAAATPGALWRFSWAAVQGYAEGAGHVFFKLRFGRAIPVPLRALDEASLAAVRRLAAAYVGETAKAR